MQRDLSIYFFSSFIWKWTHIQTQVLEIQCARTLNGYVQCISIKYLNDNIDSFLSLHCTVFTLHSIPFHSASWKYFYICVCAFFTSFDSVRLSFIGAENGGFQRIHNFSFAMVDSFSFEKKILLVLRFSLFFYLILLLNSIEFVGYFSISPWSHIDCFRIINFLFFFPFCVHFENVRKLLWKSKEKHNMVK